MAFLQIDYKSEALMRGVNIKVILPSDGMAGKWEPPYKTLYLLPGYSATATELITYLGLRGQSELKGIAIVLPDGEYDFLQHLCWKRTGRGNKKNAAIIHKERGYLYWRNLYGRIWCII